MLDVSNVSKQYSGNDFYSLKDVSFTIEKGEIVGLIGKNGAGKTTLLKLLAKSHFPTTGVIRYRGLDIFSEDNVLRPFGLMIETVYYSHLTVKQNIEFYLDIHDQSEYKKNIQSVLETVELWHKKDFKPDGFSFGMKQRLSLAMSLVTNPEFMILDEPFVGLDPDGVNDLMRILKQWAADRGTSIIVSSHQLNELEAICDRYLYIEGGALKKQFGKAAVEVTVIELVDALQDRDALFSAYEAIQAISEDGKQIEVDSNSAAFHQILGTITASHNIKKIFTKENVLNQYFKGSRDHE